MKTISIAGRVGKNAETRRTQNGDPVTSFSVAVDDGYGERKSTMWFDCSLWGNRGNSLAQHLTKGTSLSLSGELGKREHEGKTYLTIRVNELTLQGGNERKAEQPAQKQEGYGQASGGNPSPRELDDEIPF
jgi:single-strand DNA-binding protein